MLKKLHPRQTPTASDYNNLIDEVKRLTDILLTGPDTLTCRTQFGTKLMINPPYTGVNIAEVDSAATGGGYYDCHLQTLDATDWDSTTADQLDDKGDSVEVLNLAEVGGSSQELSAGDIILCWRFIDDEGIARYVGLCVLEYTEC